jgi:hypothetical protein
LATDQDSVRLLAVEGCGPFTKVLDKDHVAAHIIPVIQKFSKARAGAPCCRAPLPLPRLPCMARLSLYVGLYISCLLDARARARRPPELTPAPVRAIPFSSFLLSAFFLLFFFRY